MTKIAAQPGIMDIALYQGGASHLEGVSEVVKLSSNENPYGPSEAAIEAYRREALNLHRYPSTDHISLRLAIAEVFKLDVNRIICGVGSDEVIHFLCQAYVGQGDEVIHTEHGFAMYRISTLAAGGVPVEAGETDRRIDVDKILACVTDRTKLVFIANPNNPTGTMLGAKEVKRLAEALPEGALLVLDGAYAEYVDGFDGGAKLVDARDNVVMTRTFSKLYGLGGLRVGWGYAPQGVIDVLNRIRGPFNLSNVALAVAEAAVRDQVYADKCRADNSRLRAWLTEALAGHGVPCDKSEANFVLARFNDAEEAAACDAFLRQHGLIVRQVAGYKLPECLRITIGDEPACRRVAHTIGLFKGGAR